MKSKPSAALIGGFVVGAALLAVGALFYFGGRTWLSDTGEFVVYFDESVHGLDVGAPVKYRGVRVGRVGSIGVRYDPGEARSLIPVACELDRQVVRDAEGMLVDFSDPALMDAMVERGLRARLSLVGISGLMYIELDYVSPAEQAMRFVVPDHPELSAVPAVPSTFVGLREGITEITASIGEIDFGGIARRFETLLDRADSQLEALAVDDLVVNFNEAVTAVTELARSEDLREAVRSANVAFSDLSSILNRLDDQIDPVSERFMVTADELSQALRQLGGAVEAIETLISPRTGLGHELAATLQRLGEASRSVQRLADYLERNPNALLSGRREAGQ